MCIECGCQAIEATRTEEGGAEIFANGSAEFVPIAQAAHLAEGGLLGVEVNGQSVLLGRVGGQLYAIGGLCTHRQARLADGALEGEVVVCPLHKSGFDIRTGNATRRPALEPVPCYEVKVENGTVLVACVPKAP